MSVVCQRCNQSKATVHITDTVPDKRERHLCEDCAEKEGVIIKQKFSSTNEILKQFIKHKVGIGAGEDLSCPQCGITFREFQTKGTLGCPNDYHAFASLLNPLIERAHEGGTHHVGKTPNQGDSNVQKRTGLIRLRRELQDAIAHENYELAARVRDQVAALRRLQADRRLVPDVRDADAIAVALHVSGSCVTVLSVRDGRNLGHRSFFPQHPPEIEPAALLGEFLGQYYLERKAPAEIFVPQAPEEGAWLEASLSHHAGRKVRIATPQRGGRHRLLEMARLTAEQGLSAHRAANASMQARLADLQRVLGLDEPPQRMECFDISHTMGELTVASCVVFGPEGPLKAAYRRFNIEGLAPGDDTGSIRQAVARRFARVKSGEVPAPDVLFIDGGPGQLGTALEALQEHGLQALRVVAVAKGAGRRPGLEQLHVPEQPAPIVLPPDSPGLHLIQRLRDEAHRFAITGHRGRRDKARVTSALEAIEGLGPVKRRTLLKQLGGLAQVKRAGVDELARVPGISRPLAERIHAHFR